MLPGCSLPGFGSCSPTFGFAASRWVGRGLAVLCSHQSMLAPHPAVCLSAAAYCRQCPPDWAWPGHVS